MPDRKRTWYIVYESGCWPYLNIYGDANGKAVGFKTESLAKKWATKHLGWGYQIHKWG